MFKHTYDMQAVLTISQAAALCGIPRRTFYGYVRRGLVPTVVLSKTREVMTSGQVQVVQRVLSAEGRGGVLGGRCVDAAGR